MTTATTFDELHKLVKESGGLCSVYAEDLRNMYGAERLGIQVRLAISKELAGQGLAHFPHHLPDRQHEMVRIYQQGSQVAELIDAVLTVDAKSDSKLRKVAKNTSERTLTKIRELLEEEEA